MTGLAGAIEYLYSKFILRDFAAKIVPGSIVLLGLAVEVSGKQPGWLLARVPKVPVVLLAVGLGFVWILGLMTQQMSFMLVWPLLWCFTRRRRIPTSRYPFRTEFVDIVSRRTTAEAVEENRAQQLERLVVIKEATGNLATSMALFGGLWAAGDVRKLSVADHLGWLYLGLTIGGIALLLFLVHGDHYCKEVVMQGLLDGVSACVALHWVYPEQERCVRCGQPAVRCENGHAVDPWSANCAKCGVLIDRARGT